MLSSHLKCFSMLAFCSLRLEEEEFRLCLKTKLKKPVRDKRLLCSIRKASVWKRKINHQGQFLRCCLLRFQETVRMTFFFPPFSSQSTSCTRQKWAVLADDAPKGENSRAKPADRQFARQKSSSLSGVVGGAVVSKCLVYTVAGGGESTSGRRLFSADLTSD